MTIASALSAKISTMAAAADVPKAGSAPDASAGAPPPGNASSSESASGATQATAPSKDGAAVASTAPDASTVEHDLLKEKLAKVREERQARRLGESAKAHRERAQREADAAKEDRAAAAKERATWEGLKNGTFMDGVKAMGRDPRVVFAEVQAEALKAGTPEAQIARMQSEFERQLAEMVTNTVEPLKKTIEELTEERKVHAAEAAHRAFASDFHRHVEDPAYESLRDEYPDDRLLDIADGMRANPRHFYAQAARLRVKLQDPASGFNMRDILQVLKAAQDEHETGKTTRRTARTATNPSTAAQQAPTANPTVNGTAERRNAGATTIGNDLASSRASDAGPQLRGTTPGARIRERVRKLAGG